MMTTDSNTDDSNSSSEADAIVGWFLGRFPDDWFTGRPEFLIDRDEILIKGPLSEPAVGDDDSDAVRRGAIASRIDSFRTSTRSDRIEIAKEAQRLFDRKVSWGATCGGFEVLFTTLAAPAMTRLRMDERRVLDTLIDGGVARSRSEALAWCVRLVAANESSWLADLEEAIATVDRVRSSGPGA